MKKAKIGKKEMARETRLLNSKYWVDPMSGPMRVVKGL
jgi:hypothetical protein